MTTEAFDADDPEVIEHNRALAAAIHAAARPVADQIDAFAADIAARIDQFKARLLCADCAASLVRKAAWLRELAMPTSTFTDGIDHQRCVLIQHAVDDALTKCGVELTPAEAEYDEIRVSTVLRFAASVVEDYGRSRGGEDR